MKNLPLLVCLLSIVPLKGMAQQSGAAAAPQVFYTENNLEGAVPARPVHQSTGQADPTAPSAGRIEIRTAEHHQTMVGIGAAFSEIGTLAFAGLPADRQKELLENLFSVKDGAGFGMCRLPVGSSDFATSAYSYAETPDDYDMKAFSLARDEKSIIPAVQAALRVNPELQLFASPWSPPGWMKKSGKMDGGGENSHLRDEEPIYKAYALYFEKYVTGYLSHGVHIARLCTQNEMDCNPRYPGCLMEPAQTLKLVTDYLAPRFKASQVATEIWPGTFRESPKAPYATECMKNEKFRASLSGLGIQYFNGKLVDALAQEHPGLRFMHTEANCENGKNTAAQAAHRFGEMIGCFNSGCENYAYWNMLLDEGQKSGWGWAQNSLVTIDRTTHEVRYNPDYQPIYLVSRFVRPGSVRVESHYTGADLHKFAPDKCAFVQGENLVLLVQNKTPDAQPVDVDADGRKTRVLLPAHSDCVVLWKK